MSLKPDKILKTSRLRLEPLIEKHAELLFEVLQDKKIYAFIPEKPPVNVSALEKRYRILEERNKPLLKQIWLNWALRLRENKKYVGTLQATIYSDKTASIAYVLFPEFWQRGFAFEACIKLLELLFSEYEIGRVSAEVDRKNKSSIKLLEKLGFAMIKDQKRGNDRFYGLSKETFQEKFSLVFLNNVSRRKK